MEARWLRLFQIQNELWRAKKVTHYTYSRVSMWQRWQRCNMYVMNEYTYTHAYIIHMLSHAVLSHIISFITRHTAKGMNSHLHISSWDILIKASMASEFGILRVWPSDLFDVQEWLLGFGHFVNQRPPESLGIISIEMTWNCGCLYFRLSQNWKGDLYAFVPLFFCFPSYFR